MCCHHCLLATELMGATRLTIRREEDRLFSAYRRFLASSRQRIAAAIATECAQDS